ncbi:PTS system nitrogen regulatory IIA component [Sphingomonas kaistensis]|uniref:PTS system nitrogen regulatory IIA component n=1 Tax=Sphingomonas kaistensis TaxID=298708 RepID=A0A7X5Y4C2_9SPHN|nr:PTS sugar transporter subunit IIA [Sphingomonas kaistensis]NJC04846.1 PTS system nitrogen regulatory IIA component [Sphingomonas kaistensis]
MQLTSFLDLDSNRPSLAVSNKRALFQALGQIAGQRLQLDVAELVAALLEREKLGTTGFGNGVAIPHGKVAGLRRIYGLVAHLAEPIDYKAIDGTPVDLVFLLLSPPDAGADHLKALAAISRVVRHAPTLEKLRGARSGDALTAVLMGVDEPFAA